MSHPDEFWPGILATARQLDQHSYYDLLGVARDAGPETIGQAYYAQVRRLHPDRHAMESDPERKNALVRLYARIGEAYRVLTSPDKRKAYDSALSGGKTRLAHEQSVAAPRPKAPDPKTPQARALYERGKQLFDKGDMRGARAQWDLAIQFEPDSEVLRRALQSLDGGNPSLPLSGATPAPGPAATLRASAAASSGVKPGASKGSAPWNRPPTELTVPGEDLMKPAKGPAAVPYPCPSWDKLDSLYRRKLLGNGLAIRSAYAPPVGIDIPLAIQLPDGRVLQVASRVSSVGPARKPGRFSIRLVFGDIAAETRAAFESILAERGYPASGQPGDRARTEDDSHASGPYDQADTQELDAPSLAEDIFGGSSFDSPAVQDDAALGRAALIEGRHAMACDYLSRALEQTPDNDSVRALFYIALGHQTDATGNTREAKIHVQTALKLDASAIEWLK